MHALPCVGVRSYRTLGGGNLIAGFEKMNQMPYAEARKLVTHPVACIDCHAPRTMQLRVTRPGFVNGIRALAQSKDALPHLPSVERWRSGNRAEPYDPNRDATRQEMRSFVCAQCHVEYYCGPKEPLLLPWGNGLKVEQIESFYDDHAFPGGEKFHDWTHGETGAPHQVAQVDQHLWRVRVDVRVRRDLDDR